MSMNSRSLFNEYMHPSIIEAGPFYALPPKFFPRVKDYYFPAQLNLGIDFNDEEIRTFAEKHNIRLYDDFSSTAFKVAKHCTKTCGVENKRPIMVTTLAQKGAYCLSFIDNYDLNQCRLEDLDEAIWQLEELWHQAGFTSKLIMWHTSGTQANRRNIISTIDPSVIV